MFLIKSKVSSSSPSSSLDLNNYDDDCLTTNGTITFELITGFVFTSSANTVMSMIPGVLHLADCLDYCRQNQTCNSLNFETGLCVLLSSSAIQLPDALTPSQFPVFTIYAQKICLKGMFCIIFFSPHWIHLKNYNKNGHKKNITVVVSWSWPYHFHHLCAEQKNNLVVFSRKISNEWLSF